MVYEEGAVLFSGVESNFAILAMLRPRKDGRRGRAEGCDLLAIEMVASYGMPVGKEVFETCVWIGRFQQEWSRGGTVRLIYRREVKLHLVGNVRAKDANVWQALVDRFGPVGSKHSPGPLYGVKSHARAALALAVTAVET